MVQLSGLANAVSDIQWTRINQLRLAWTVTQGIAVALVISIGVAASKVGSDAPTAQFQLIWYCLTVLTWSAFSSIVLLVNVPWITMDPSIAFGALVASTAFLITVAVNACVIWATNVLASLTSVSVFSALLAVCLTVDLAGFLQFKDDLIGDTATMEAPNVIAAIPSPAMKRNKEYYDQRPAEQA
ncbi:MARVEL domain-containing protein [Plasmodiophora brassicae]|uniref:MARVEL domain-containing protein n=1 Tax=Plasmodiophora brassicae TaxID=37360 RepID=A0A0G4J913_PLABS|nr:hypothetical protein PBRA_003541 [Plasmodiophora brassicae]SPQ99894.1 unnamed protein product [Plasmodiophora brassicae]